MGHQKPLFTTMLVCAVLLGTAATTLARGGGGGHGGGHAGGSRHSGSGGHSCGGHGHSSGGGSGGSSSTGRYGAWTVSGGIGTYAHASSGVSTWHYPTYGYGPGPGIGVSFGNGTLGAPPDAAVTPSPETPAMPPQLDAAGQKRVHDLIDKGERAFKARDYETAVQIWRQAACVDPRNGLLLMMLGQALFATGEYNEAAYATQAAMQQLPMAQWGVVVGHYTHLYGTVTDYAEQLRALEKAQRARPDNPALRFLIGFQLGYLGFIDQAIEQLDETLVLVPHDEMTDLLRNMILIKGAKSTAAHPAPGSPLSHGFVPTWH